MSDTPQHTAVDLSDQAEIRWDLTGRMTYGDYLGLDRLLDAQRPISGEHDEMLFIVIHQTMELWIKLCLHEIRAAMAHIADDDLGPVFKMLSRVARVQTQMLQSWETLATMTPTDYLRFRDGLESGSGFQSHQYRMLEFTLGNKNRKLAEVHKSVPERYAQVRAALDTPSLYDECLRLLARRGFDIAADRVERDWSAPYRAHDSVEAAWHAVYDDAKRHWELYDLAEKLVDLEHRFQQWRFAHMKTVERIIGHRRGTGGTTGVSYLVRALDLKFFPELWSVRTRL